MFETSLPVSLVIFLKYSCDHMFTPPCCYYGMLHRDDYVWLRTKHDSMIILLRHQIYISCIYSVVDFQEYSLVFDVKTEP